MFEGIVGNEIPIDRTLKVDDIIVTKTGCTPSYSRVCFPGPIRLGRLGPLGGRDLCKTVIPNTRGHN